MFGSVVATAQLLVQIVRTIVISASCRIFNSRINFNLNVTFAFSLGGESLAVAQNTYAVSWFMGRELNMVFGLQLSFSRVVSSLRNNSHEKIYNI